MILMWKSLLHGLFMLRHSDAVDTWRKYEGRSTMANLVRKQRRTAQSKAGPVYKRQAADCAKWREQLLPYKTPLGIMDDDCLTHPTDGLTSKMWFLVAQSIHHFHLVQHFHWKDICLSIRKVGVTVFRLRTTGLVHFLWSIFVKKTLVVVGLK